MNHQDRKAPRDPIPASVERIASEIVDSAYKVHSSLGPGLLERVYEVCLTHELRERSLSVRTQVEFPIEYNTLKIDSGLRLDLVVEDAVVVELKAIENLLPVHEAQILTYLKLTGYRLGFLLNFNVPKIKDGCKRFVL